MGLSMCLKTFWPFGNQYNSTLSLQKFCLFQYPKELSVAFFLKNQKFEAPQFVSAISTPGVCQSFCKIPGGKLCEGIEYQFRLTGYF